MLLVTLYVNSTNYTDDARMWKELQEGERKALAVIFRKYYNLLLNYGLKLIPREGLVKDSIQELFFNLWEQRERLSDVEYVRSYLYSSLRRTIYRQAEIQNVWHERDRMYSRESFREMVNKEELMILDELEEEQREKLKQALESLTIRQKEAVFLKFYNGLSNDEIADIMDVNKQSVYNYIHRAVLALQASIGNS